MRDLEGGGRRGGGRFGGGEGGSEGGDVHIGEGFAYFEEGSAEAYVVAVAFDLGFP